MPPRRSIPSAKQSQPSKRALSPEPPSKGTPSRQSKRLKSSPITKTTPQKSPYFEDPTSEESDVVGKEQSGYEDEDASAVSSPASSDDDDEEEASDSNESEAYASKRKPPKKKNPSRPTPHNHKSTTSPTAATATDSPSELWRPGTKSHLAPGKAIYIPIPKARPAGSTPYKPNTLHPNTLLFLADLATHNDRDWLRHHDANYRASLADWVSFVDSLTSTIVHHDTTIPPDLPAKDLIFRIYRDVRFSADQTPYKTFFSAAWSRTGKKGPYAAYYVRVQPGGKSFVGGGLWCPEREPWGWWWPLVAGGMGEGLKRVLRGEEIRREFLMGKKGGKKGSGGDVDVQRFVELNHEGMLKVKPKGYESNHPNINILRLRNYTIGKTLQDEEISGKGGLERIAELIGILEPFVTYLNSVVMPDEEEEGEDDDDSDQGEDGEDGDEDEDEDEE